jgi:endoglucanase
VTLERHKHHQVSRREFLKWSGAGTVVGASLLTACHGATTTPPSRGADSKATESVTPTAGGREATAPPSTVAASPTFEALAQLNYLHTEGGTIRDNSGREVTLTGLNWFGMETDTLAPHGLWARGYRDMLDQIVQLEYNCLRLPFSNELFDPKLEPNGIDFTQNPDLKGLNGLQIMDKIIVEAGKRGLKIILDQHRPTTDSQSPLWNTPELTTQEWLDQWRTLAQRYLGNDAVIGADLHNEPCGDATWGSGDPVTSWSRAAENCANEILKVNPQWLILVEGIEKIVDKFGNVFDWTWQGGELINARVRPIKPDVPNRLVYSPHDYGPSVYDQGWFNDPKFPDNLPGFWDFHWGYLQRQGIAPILVGEFGGPLAGNNKESQWQRTLVNYLKTNNMHYTYWAFNANSADTGGLLEPDWKSINEAKQSLLKTHQGKLIGNKAPDVVNTSAVPKVSPNRLPMKALHFDNSAVQWTTMLKPELYVMNKTLDPMDLSNVEMRYWFAPNGDPDPSAHTVQVAGTTTQNFGKVLGADQVRAEIVHDKGISYAGNPVLYVRVTFAPGTTAPKRDGVGFGLHVQKKGGQYYQPSHYSYRDYHWPSEWNRIGLYRDGKLVWGVEPQTYEATEAAKERAIQAQRSKYLTK